MKLTKADVRELLDYNPRTGLFRWKLRSLKWFDTARAQKAWNTKWAGKQAFTYKRVGSRNSYIYGCVNSKKYAGHSVAFLWMTGRWPCEEIDHINGNGYDNRWKNLREVTIAENSKNKRRQHGHNGKDLRFKHIGIKLNNHRYGARIAHQGKKIWLGTFDTINQAIAARQKAQREYGFTERHGK